MVDNGDKSKYVERFHITAELVDTGIAIKRASLARSNPGASESELDTLVAQWLRGRPADCPGKHRKLT